VLSYPGDVPIGRRRRRRWWWWYDNEEEGKKQYDGNQCG